MDHKRTSPPTPRNNYSVKQRPRMDPYRRNDRRDRQDDRRRHERRRNNSSYNGHGNESRTIERLERTVSRLVRTEERHIAEILELTERMHNMDTWITHFQQTLDYLKTKSSSGNDNSSNSDNQQGVVDDSYDPSSSVFPVKDE